MCLIITIYILFINAYYISSNTSLYIDLITIDVILNARLKINKEINEIHTDIDNVESDIIEDMDVIVQKFA